MRAYQLTFLSLLPQTVNGPSITAKPPNNSTRMVTHAMT
jgi:hypothetical protein